MNTPTPDIESMTSGIVQAIIEENISELNKLINWLENAEASESDVTRIYMDEVRPILTLVYRFNEHHQKGKGKLLIETPTQPTIPSLPQEKQPNRTKKPHTRLVVTMANGEVISRPYAIATFVEVIEKLGPREASNVCPDIVSPVESNVHDRQVGQSHYYVKSQTNTATKKRMLEEIASRLNIQLTVERTL